MTVRELGPGWIVGEERLVTMESRTFRLPGKYAQVRLLRYGAQGVLLDSDTIVDASADEGIEVAVPEGGLAIVERVPGR